MIVILFSVIPSLNLIGLEAIMKDKGDRFEKPLSVKNHYSKTLVFKIFFYDHVHSLTKLPFYTGPNDMADPVYATIIVYSNYGMDSARKVFQNSCWLMLIEETKFTYTYFGLQIYQIRTRLGRVLRVHTSIIFLKK